MRILITGASGQVGSELVRAWDVHGERDIVVALNREALDVSDRSAVMERITAERPDAVVNCAAKTAVDDCENDRDGTFSVNTSGVAYLAEACVDIGAHLTTISTDYVFDGTKREPYTENDPTNPLSVYGQSKLAAERTLHQALQADDTSQGLSATVVRTSLVFGAYGSNMVKAVLTQLRSRKVLYYVTDLVACPTFAADLASVLLRLTRKRVTGLFHVANQGVVSRFDLACAVVRAVGEDTNRVLPTTTGSLPQPHAATRPAYSALDCTTLASTGEPPLRHFTEPLAELVEELTVS